MEELMTEGDRKDGGDRMSWWFRLGKAHGSFVLGQKEGFKLTEEEEEKLLCC